jgi:hypothetical protein
MQGNSGHALPADPWRAWLRQFSQKGAGRIVLVLQKAGLRANWLNESDD